MLLKNNYIRQLQLCEDMKMFEHPLMSLIFHTEVILTYHSNLATKEFIRVFKNPNLLAEHFLPTMPDNMVFKLKKEIKSLGRLNENLTVNICPNGHPYLIGDCGRPYYTGKCNECGVEIGGRGHTYHAGNQFIDMDQQRTLPGHIIGHPENRNENVDRISQLHSNVMRALLHIVMIVVANRDSCSVRNSIRVHNQIQNLTGFLLNHLKRDVEIIRSILKKSEEAIYILFHNILKIMSNFDGKLKGDWSDPDKREQWEKRFSELVIEKAINTLDDAEIAITSDDRLSSNPFFATLVDKCKDVQDPILPKCTRVWVNRETINLDRTLRELQKHQKTEETDFLLMSLTLVDQLGAIKYLPDVIQFITNITRNLQGKYHRPEILTKTIGDYLHILDYDGKNIF